MHDRKNLCRLSLPLIAAATLLVLASCRTIPEGTLGSAITQNGITVTVTSSELRYLDLEGLQGGAGTDAPYLVIGLSLANGSESALRYDLNWGASATTQAQTPLLFVALGDLCDPLEASLCLQTAGEDPVTSGDHVTQIHFLGDLQFLEDPVTEVTNVPAGGTLDDLMVFAAPPAGTTELVLSINPGMFGADNRMPAYVRIPVSQVAPLPPTGLPLGTAHVGPGFEFSVTSAVLEWVAMTDSTTGRAGFSDHPLLRVNFEVNNTGERELVYSPPGVSHTEFAPSLMAGEVQVPQATFSPTVAVAGAQTSRASIAGGASYTGFLLFEAPAPDVTSLQLSLPAKRFDSTGVIRIDLSYAHREVPAPTELTPQVIEAAPAE